MDFDHEGITFTPWGNRSLSIKNLQLRGVSIDLKITGSGNHIGSLKLNGKTLPAESRKIAWAAMKGKRAKIELIRSQTEPNHPVIIRADGLRISSVKTLTGSFTAQIEGDMSGEVVISANAKPKILLNGEPLEYPYDARLRIVTIPFDAFAQQSNHLTLKYES
jgi:hypothetical protein